MFIRVAGVRLNYETLGSGDPVIVLHGWGATIQSVWPVVTHLSDRFQVYALDFPGFGKSQKPPTAWGVGDYAECFLGFLEALNIPKATLIGHSFGGRVSIVTAARWPQVVDKIVLVDSAGIRPKRTLGYHLKVWTAKTGRRIASSPVLARHKTSIEQQVYKFLGASDYASAGDLRPTFVQVVNEDLRPLLPQVAAPTLLVWGENDDSTPVSDARIMQAEMPNASLIVLQNAGHFSYLDDAAGFNRAIDSFLVPA